MQLKVFVKNAILIALEAMPLFDNDNLYAWSLEITLFKKNGFVLGWVQSVPFLYKVFILSVFSEQNRPVGYFAKF